MWATRDKNGGINLWWKMPIRHHLNDAVWEGGMYMGILNKRLFPELTFENSPMEVELKIKEK